MDGHGAHKNRIITRSEIRQWAARFDVDHNGLSDKEGADVARRYEQLVRTRTAVR